MGQRNTLSGLYGLGLYPRHNCALWLDPHSRVPILPRFDDRQSDGMEGMERDVIVGEHPAGPRRASSSEIADAGVRISDGKRAYAVANITHGTVTMLCAANVTEAYGKVRIHPTDVIWHTTRIEPGQTHPHGPNGQCIPKVYRTNREGKYSSR